MSSKANKILKGASDIVGSSKTEYDKRLDEHAFKKEAVSMARTDRDYKQTIESVNVIKQFQNLTLDITPEILEQTKKDNTSYFKHAAEKRLFLNQKVFHGIVPFHGKNLIVVGATTGSGKTTIASNLSFHDIAQGGKTLVITNEETREDVFNRNTCIGVGWHYQNHADFSEAKIKYLNDNMSVLAPNLSIITDTHGGATFGVTTTLEGVVGVLTTALDQYQATGEFYSSIIIDYYQGITTSIQFPELVSWQVQERLALFLDNFKNQYPGPIVILSQLKPGDEDFKTRIEGRKMLINKATVALEVIADKDKMATQFKVHKGRYSNALGGKGITLGYEKGKYVEYSSAFQDQVDMSRIQQASRGDAAKKLKELSGGNDENKKTD